MSIVHCRLWQIGARNEAAIVRLALSVLSGQRIVEGFVSVSFCNYLKTAIPLLTMLFVGARKS